MSLRAATIAFALLASSLWSAGVSAHSAQGDSTKALYSQNCQQCHGVRGVPPKGMQMAYPEIPTFNSAFLASHTPDSIVKVLTHGKGKNMPSFKGRLTSDQMSSLATYVRGLATK